MPQVSLLEILYPSLPQAPFAVTILDLIVHGLTGVLAEKDLGIIDHPGNTLQY